MTIEELKQVQDYSNQILKIIAIQLKNDKNSLSQSDLQAVIDAIIHKIMANTKREGTSNKEIKNGLENLTVRCFKEVAYLRKETTDRETWYEWHIQTLKDMDNVISQIEV